MYQAGELRVIGGKDTVVCGPLHKSAALLMLLRIVNRTWSEAVIEPDGQQARPVRELLSNPRLLPLDADEYFIYRNDEARRSWDQEGCSECNDADMVHLLLGSDNSVTLVEAEEGTIAADFVRRAQRQLHSRRGGLT